MTETITIIPYGSLRRLRGATPMDRWTQAIAQPQSVSRLLETIGISDRNVQLVMVNHRAAGLDTEVGAGDRVALFPKEYPIFVDWHSFRQSNA